MMAIIASVGCAGRIDTPTSCYCRSGAGDGGDADPRMARSCFRGKRCRWDLLELTINSGSGLINIAHKPAII
jgi:hypothetical protein